MLRAGEALDELVVGDRIADSRSTMAATWVSKIGCGISPPRCQTISMSWRAAWKTLITLLVGHQLEERREVDARRQRIDDDGLVRAGHLDDAELRPDRSSRA